MLITAAMFPLCSLIERLCVIRDIFVEKRRSFVLICLPSKKYHHTKILSLSLTAVSLIFSFLFAVFLSDCSYICVCILSSLSVSVYLSLSVYPHTPSPSLRLSLSISVCPCVRQSVFVSLPRSSMVFCLSAYVLCLFIRIPLPLRWVLFPSLSIYHFQQVFVNVSVKQSLSLCHFPSQVIPVCPSVCLFVCLSAYLPACLPACLSLCLSVNYVYLHPPPPGSPVPEARLRLS